MKKRNCLYAAAFFLVTESQAVTLSFSGFGAGNQTVLGNSAGIATNGMTWGIVVDRAGGDNGFGYHSEIASTFQYGIASNPVIPLVNGLIGETDDYLIISSSVTSNSAGATGVASLVNFSLAASGLTGGEKFAIIWFETGAAGEDFGGYDSVTYPKYGIVANDAFVVPPSEGATVDIVASRGGSPIGGTSYFLFIPEPSTLLLGLVGALGVFRRRRWPSML